MSREDDQRAAEAREWLAAKAGYAARKSDQVKATAALAEFDRLRAELAETRAAAEITTRRAHESTEDDQRAATELLLSWARSVLGVTETIRDLVTSARSAAPAGRAWPYAAGDRVRFTPNGEECIVVPAPFDGEPDALPGQVWAVPADRPWTGLPQRIDMDDLALVASARSATPGDAPAAARPAAEPGTILHAWQQVCRLVDPDELVSPASIVDRVGMLVERSTAAACVCGDPWKLGVAHRADGPCWHPDAAARPAGDDTAPPAGCEVTGGSCDPSYAWSAPRLARKLDAVHAAVGVDLDTPWPAVIYMIRTAFRQFPWLDDVPEPERSRRIAEYDRDAAAGPRAGDTVADQDVDKGLTMALVYAATAARAEIGDRAPRMTSLSAALMAEWMVDHGWPPVVDCPAAAGPRAGDTAPDDAPVAWWSPRTRCVYTDRPSWPAIFAEDAADAIPLAPARDDQDGDDR